MIRCERYICAWDSRDPIGFYLIDDGTERLACDLSRRFLETLPVIFRSSGPIIEITFFQPACDVYVYMCDVYDVYVYIYVR